jgi:hypothetical protein
VRCASAGAERPEGALRAGPAYVVTPQAECSNPRSFLFLALGITRRRR